MVDIKTDIYIPYFYGLTRIYWRGGQISDGDDGSGILDRDLVLEIIIS